MMYETFKWIFVFILLVIIVFFINGCAPKVVDVALDCPAIQLPPDPIMQTKLLTNNSKYDVVAKSWYADVASWIGWNKAVRKQVAIVNSADTIKK